MKYRHIMAFDISVAACKTRDQFDWARIEAADVMAGNISTHGVSSIINEKPSGLHAVSCGWCLSSSPAVRRKCLRRTERLEAAAYD